MHKVSSHIPVLLEEAIELLEVGPNKSFIDATLGGGGYSAEILKRSYPNGRLLAIDWNERAIRMLQDKLVGESDEVRSDRPEPHRSDPAALPKRFTAVKGNFRSVEQIAHSNKFEYVDGIVFDLGLSSDLLDFSGRGFSYNRDEPLIMTYDSSPGPDQKTARDILNSLSEKDLEEVFRTYGEVKHSKKIAKEIVRARKTRKIETTKDLCVLIETATSSVKIKSKIFQSLRIKTIF